jgi:RimJ/RimL family protein N-acetyltransferase
MAPYPPMQTRLATGRLILRPWSVADADWNRALLAERGAPAPTTEEVRERIVHQSDNSVRTGLSLLVVQRRDDGDVLGYCGLIVGRATIDEPEIAYELFRRAHGHGFATEAAGAVIAAAAATGRTRLWSTVRTWNAASLRVLEKLGFEPDHTTTDDHGEVVWLTRTLRDQRSDGAPSNP